MSTHRIDHIAKYKKFITARDQAAEKIYQNFQIQISNELGTFLVWFADLIRARLSRVVGGDKGVFFIPHVLKDLDKEYEKKKQATIWAVTRLIAKMKEQSNALAFAAQAEALARATGKTPPKIKHQKNNDLMTSRFGQPIYSRVELALDRIKRKAFDKIQLSMIDGADLDAAMKRILLVFPKTKKFKVARRIKRLTEAMKDTKLGSTDLLTGTVDDEIWRQIVASYKRDEKLDRRGPEYVVKGKPNEPGAIYEWEVEQQASDEFYHSVIEGDKAASSQMDVDLVWIAVLDDRTGDSDRWRDGRLLSEIKDVIDENGEDPFGNDLLSPPIHQNCRCRVAPVTADIPEPRMVDNEDFDAWLNAK